MSETEFYTQMRNSVIQFYRSQEKPTQKMGRDLVNLVNFIGEARGISHNFTLKQLGVVQESKK